MKLRSILCGVLAIAAAVACKPEDVVETPKLDVDKTAVSVTAEAGQATFNVTTNQDWTASADADWVSVNPNNGKASDKAVAVKVTAEDNATEAERTATVTVKAGSLSKTVKVTQAAKSATPEPPVDEPEFEVNELYMLGSACDTGWSLDEMQAFANDGGIFTWTGNLNSEGEFRFPLQKVSNQWWPCLMISADGKSLVYGTSDDEKVVYNVPETGNYTITINAKDVAAMTVDVAYNGPVTEGPEVSWGLMGCFVDNLWATDVPMTKEGEWIVAKNAQFTELTFKIRGNASWNDKHNMGYAPGTEKGLVNARLAVVTAEYSKANLGGDCVDIKLNGPAGTYDVYFSYENLEVYVMEAGYKPGEREPIQVEPKDVTYTVVGTLNNINWNNSAPEGLMTKEGDYYVGKNVPLVTAKTLYDGADQIEFKIVETGTWDGYGVASGTAAASANAEIAVIAGGDNIPVVAAEGAYDVYFDKANGKVWVMTPGYKPGEEVPGGEEPADYDIDGKQWLFTWNALGGAPCVIDFGVTQPGTAVLAYDMGAIEPSYAGIYFPYMFGEYTITKTDGTSGVVALTSEGMTIEIPYSNATENSVHFATAALLEEDVDCTLATSPVAIYMESTEGLADGEYWIIANDKVATPLTGNYGYLQVVDAVDGRSTAANAFTFTQVEAGLYTIQDSNGKYYYQTGSYNSFNVADEDGMTDEFLWEVYDTGNGQFAIINYEVGKYIQYDTQYNSYGSYMDERGILPTLVLAENPITEPEPTPGETLAHPLTSNIEWTLGTKAYSDKATINGNADVSVLKLGTSELTGDATVVIPAGTTKVGFYGVAWKNKKGTLTASSDVAGGKFYEMNLVSNDGATSTAPYTMTVSDEADYYELDVVALLGSPCPMDLPVTLSTVENATRVILFGLNYYTE